MSAQEMNKIKLSIITPVYNGERFIESCLKSIVEQDCMEVEHIIVDGASTDKTIQIVKEFAKKYPHIRWISEKDKGQSDAMNKGIAMARGEVLGILNADDYYEPNVFHFILDKMKNLPKSTLIVGNCNVWNTAGRLEFINKPKKLRITSLLLGWRINQYPANPAAYFYHKALHDHVGLYNVDDHYSMDLDFLLKAVRVAHVCYYDKVWGNYRRIEGTKTASDLNSGNSQSRFAQIRDAHLETLPLWKRLQVKCTIYVLTEGMYYIGRMKYYFLNPKKIPDYINTIIKRRMSG